MTADSDAEHVHAILSRLGSPDASLVRELLDLLARDALPDADQTALLAPPLRKKFKSPGSQRRRDVRQAVFDRLKSAWIKVAGLPACTEQARILRETAHLGLYYLDRDPIDSTHPLFTAKRAGDYAARALAVSQELGDRIEVVDALSVLAVVRKMDAEFSDALRYAREALGHAENIGNRFLMARALGVITECHSMLDVETETRIDSERTYIRVAAELGEVGVLLSRRYQLSHLLIADGRPGELSEQVAEMEDLLADLRARDALGDTLGVYDRMHLVLRAWMKREAGDLDGAIADLHEGIVRHLRSDMFREDHLWNDLAWLESCHLEAGTPDRFSVLCDELQSIRPLDLEQWYLEPCRTPPKSVRLVSQFTGVHSTGDWIWKDPTGKSRIGEYGTRGYGHAITPVTGVGIFSNVHVPRVTKLVEGDFSVVVHVDGSTSPEGAGGILVYADDQRLIRLGIGIQYDREVTLTKKIANGQLLGIARGMARSASTLLRLERHGDLFEALCSDGRSWWRCGTTEFDLPDRLEVGVFAECTYRMFSLRRGEVHPFRFFELSLGE